MNEPTGKHTVAVAVDAVARGHVFRHESGRMADGVFQKHLTEGLESAISYAISLGLAENTGLELPMPELLAGRWTGIALTETGAADHSARNPIPEPMPTADVWREYGDEELTTDEVSALDSLGVGDPHDNDYSARTVLAAYRLGREHGWAARTDEEAANTPTEG